MVPTIIAIIITAIIQATSIADVLLVADRLLVVLAAAAGGDGEFTL